MTDLTEKWKAGELPHGAFYVKVFTGAILVDFFDATILKFVRCEDDIEEVIDYVPCYTNLQAIKERADALSDRVNCQKNRIACLEYDLNRCNRLLKECQEIIEWYKADCGYKDLPTESVLTKIEEVLK